MGRTERRLQRLLAAAGLAALATVLPVTAQSLRPSRASLDSQNLEAHQHRFTYLEDAGQVRRFVELGYLVPVTDGDDHFLKEVSFPYARPAVKIFIERLAGQYRETCNEQLVVTSLTRPKDRQPYNASSRSVHPTGMALDLRRPWSHRCRGWLEHTLVTLEEAGVLDATREAYPPHYHIAVFPDAYEHYVDELPHRPPASSYLVMRGDTLWKIARRHHTTIDVVKRQNGLRSSRIYPGQVLQVPTAGR